MNYPIRYTPATVGQPIDYAALRDSIFGLMGGITPPVSAQGQTYVRGPRGTLIPAPATDLVTVPPVQETVPESTSVAPVVVAPASDPVVVIPATQEGYRSASMQDIQRKLENPRAVLTTATTAADETVKLLGGDKGETKKDATKTKETETKAEPIKPQVTSPVTQTATAQPITFGTDFYVVPRDGFTSPSTNNAAPITIDPVTMQYDNGGLQHGAMNILYQNTPATFGQTLAFANLMQGKRELSGGISAMTETQQDIDKMNAYAAQGQVANRVQELMSSGLGMNEARYQALTEYGLANGLNRMAIGATMPEYAKYADERSKREMDATAAAGGSYNARGAFGYTPLGVNGFSVNSDGTMNISIGGNVIKGVPTEYGLSSVYGAIKGDGYGSSNAATQFTSAQDKRYKYGTDISDNAVKVEELKTGKGLSKQNGLTLKERMVLETHKADEAVRKEQEKSKLKSGGVGNTSGFTGFTY